MHFLPRITQFFCRNFWCFPLWSKTPYAFCTRPKLDNTFISSSCRKVTFLCQGMSCVRKLHQSSWADWKEVAPEYCMSSSNFSTTDSVILSPSHLQKFSGSCHFCFFLTPLTTRLCCCLSFTTIWFVIFPQLFSSSIWIKEFLFLSFQFGPFWVRTGNMKMHPAHKEQTKYVFELMKGNTFDRPS